MMSVKDVFLHIGHGIKVVVVGAGHKILSVIGGGDEKKGIADLEAMGQFALHSLGSALGQIVLRQVSAVQAAPSDKYPNTSDGNLRKYQDAFSAIVSEAEATGISWSEYWVDTLIQFAVGAVKNYYNGVSG